MLTSGSRTAASRRPTVAPDRRTRSAATFRPTTAVRCRSSAPRSAGRSDVPPLLHTREHLMRLAAFALGFVVAAVSAYAQESLVGIYNGSFNWQTQSRGVIPL